MVFGTSHNLITLNIERMKRWLPLLFIITSCADSSPKQANATRSVRELDSLIEIQKANYVPPKEEFKDTIGLSTSPIKVISTKLIEEEYSNDRSISITYKNVSGKNIDGIRFHWMTSGTWGVEDMGRYSSLRTDELLKAGRTHTRIWTIRSDNKKKCFAWPHEVVFSDGSIWQLNK
jgi:hypothetical protein